MNMKELEHEKLKYKLCTLAQKTAKSIRQKRLLSGWHEDESMFPQCSYEEVVKMMLKAREI